MAKFKVGDKVRVIKEFYEHKVGKVSVIDRYDPTDGRLTYGLASGGWVNDDVIELVKEDASMTKQYRTEKRKARVGERIIVTNAVRTFGDYDNGDIFTVKRFSMYNSGVMVEELKGDAPYIGHDEYEVIIGDTQPTPTLTARVTELEAKVAELETQLAGKTQTADTTAPMSVAEAGKAIRDGLAKALEAVAKVTTPNQRRAAVIKQAREFVAEHTKHNGRAGRNSGVLVGHYVTIPEFIVNAEKRTVVVLMKGVNGSHPVFAKGFAKCAADDVFNVDIGKAIALARALDVKVPAEFLNAPKPSEIVVGMRVEWDGSRYHYPGFSKEIGPPGRYIDAGDMCAIDSMFAKKGIIIDDTEAQYEALA